MPMLTPTLTRARVPVTQPLTSVRVHASMDTRSCGSSVDILRMKWLMVLITGSPRKVDNAQRWAKPTQGQTAQRWLERYGGTTPSHFAEPSQVGSTMATTNTHAGVNGQYEHEVQTQTRPCARVTRREQVQTMPTSVPTTWTFMLVHHPHDLPNLAALHGDVNRHPHCRCEVSWSVLVAYSQIGYTGWSGVWVVLGYLITKRSEKLYRIWKLLSTSSSHERQSNLMFQAAIARKNWCGLWGLKHRNISGNIVI